MRRDISSRFISEEQLKGAELDELQSLETSVEDRLITTRALKTSALAGKFVCGGMAAINLAFTAQTPDALHISSSGAAITLALAGHLLHQQLEKRETVLDFNLASTESEIDRRIRFDGNN